MNTVLDILTKGTRYLEDKGIDDARRTMELLLTHVLKCDRLGLYMRFDEAIPEATLTPLRSLMQRKAAGEPLQHLLGYTEFYGRSFRTDKRALIPRPETEELIEHVLNLYKSGELPNLPDPRRVLDMGTGSGIIGITLALELPSFLPQSSGISPEVSLVDISEDALSLALENALSHRVRVRALKGDLFSAFDTQDSLPQFDLILANLPYIADGESPTLSPEVHADPASALYGGERGTEIIERFLENAQSYLSPGGLVALEIGWNQGDFIANLMKKLGYRDVLLLSDLAGVPRFPLGRAPF